MLASTTSCAPCWRDRDGTWDLGPWGRCSCCARHDAMCRVHVMGGEVASTVPCPLVGCLWRDGGRMVRVCCQWPAFYQRQARLARLGRVRDPQCLASRAVMSPRMHGFAGRRKTTGSREQGRSAASHGRGGRCAPRTAQSRCACQSVFQRVVSLGYATVCHAYLVFDVRRPYGVHLSGAGLTPLAA